MRCGYIAYSTPMGDRSVTLIHTLFTADSQQFAEDSQGFARIHAVVSRNTRPIRTIRAPFARIRACATSGSRGFAAGTRRFAHPPGAMHIDSRAFAVIHGS